MTGTGSPSPRRFARLPVLPVGSVSRRTASSHRHGRPPRHRGDWLRARPVPTRAPRQGQEARRRQGDSHDNGRSRLTSGSLALEKRCDGDCQTRGERRGGELSRPREAADDSNGNDGGNGGKGRCFDHRSRHRPDEDGVEGKQAQRGCGHSAGRGDWSNLPGRLARRELHR